MGSGMWSPATYAATTGAKISSGSTFGYDRTVRATGKYEAHPDLDPKKVAGDASPYAGQVMRESRDNEDHPNSTPIILGFDSTGSMGTVPRVLQKKLADVFGLILRKGYAPDPQIMISTYGDAYVDMVPLQVSQFESDNRIDANLDNLFLEGGGGGNDGETASLLFYYAAHHTVTDAWEKRNKKGYMFVIADEKMLPLRPDQVSRFVGDGQPLQSDLSPSGIAKAVKEKWDVYILLIDNLSAKVQGSEEHYKKLFGADHVLVIENPDTIGETIAVAIGALEGAVDNETAADDLLEAGSTDLVVRSVSRAVAPLVRNRGVVAKGNVELDAGAGAARL